ncbi:hypothetical protein [Bacillus sp. SRB3LM]|uniref:hypothetical protein n=1 Tax=Bacillus sp. SRB3LM TaxID=2608689 RepID=UPI0018C3E108|nr:hypothetical protein [Bacillus sp. SRB3LM]MBG0971321.1 hypothetical protein [Bacillus sp. SRB3LM]MBG0972906.1 hypothetical protein [Bacillus sp. SRB3LM]
MHINQQCQCEICKNNKKELPTIFSNIHEGDLIKVFSNGNFMGVGTFLKFENNLIFWLDKRGNMNITDLTLSNIKKITAKITK